jgi:cytochrome c peroxidase
VTLVSTITLHCQVARLRSAAGRDGTLGAPERSAMRALLMILVSSVVGCGMNDLGTDEAPLTSTERTQIASRIRAQFAARRIAPIPTKTIPGNSPRRTALIKLGQALAFDKILSDNKDVSCMTCHPPAVGGDDDRHLSIGVRGIGLGASRSGGIDIPRNAPPLFNLHVLDSMFWDGRVEKLPNGAYRTPAGSQLTPAMTAVFEFGAMSAIGMFPITNRDEMREHDMDGQFDDLTALADDDFTGIWNAAMNRLRSIPKYREMFGDAYPSWPGTRTNRIDTMTFAHASNAMAAFFIDKFTSKDSPWDDFVAGKNDAFKIIEDYTRVNPPTIFERDVLLGADRFLQTCANCHDGPTLSDNRYHNTALAQFGPGVGDGDSLRDDFGRQRVVTVNDPDARCGNAGMGASCRFAFRTTPLRNVVLTAPYGHAGQIGRFGNHPSFGTDVRDDLEDLRAFVAHYALDPKQTLREYDISQIESRLQASYLFNTDEVIAHVDPLFANGSPITLEDVDILTAFMVAQTSKALFGAGLESGVSARFALCGAIPLSVPSGLALDVDAADEDDCKKDNKDNDDFDDDSH